MLSEAAAESGYAGTPMGIHSRSQERRPRKKEWEEVEVKQAENLMISWQGRE